MAHPGTQLLAFLGGALAILSPCVLPIVPLLFGGAGRRFSTTTGPMLAGLAVSFGTVASLGTVTLGWIASAGALGRWMALTLLAVVGLSLWSERIAAWAARPLVALGARLGTAERSQGAARSFVVGIATGLLWAPCAGPILGLVIAAAAAHGPGAGTTLLFFDFALGASVALGAVLYLGGRLLDRIRWWGSADRWARRTTGAIVVGTVLALSLGADRALLARGTFTQTARVETALIGRLAPASRQAAGTRDNAPPLADAFPATDEGPMQDFPAATKWLNSGALTPASLKGKVVLVEFWTFECINCLHALPYVKDLYAKYKDRGFVVVGVHTPELPAERVVSNVERQVGQLGITFPVVIDNSYSIWNAWRNEYWPALYFIDAHGRVRYHHFGEGAYAEEDQVVQKLLYEAGL